MIYLIVTIDAQHVRCRAIPPEAITASGLDCNRTVVEIIEEFLEDYPGESIDDDYRS